ncbi:TRM11 family SAM-dependent methyltransferase [Nanoarchaeota archaeon]
MKLILELSLDNPLLGVEEIKATTKSTIKRFDKYVVLETNKDLKKLAKLAYTHNIFEFLFMTKNLEKKIETFDWQRAYRKDFSVKVYTPKSSLSKEKEFSKIIWKKLKNPEVNLKNASTKIFFFKFGERWLCGRFICETDKSYLQRFGRLLPESRPIITSPKLTRACINLTGISGNEVILDPFAGFGTTLIEAKLMGLKAEGYDLDETIIKKAKSNAEKMGVRINLIKNNALDIKKKYDYVVTDVPYARNTSKKINVEELVTDFLNNAYNKIKKKITIIIPSNLNYKKILKNTKWKKNQEFEQYIHKSLSKRILLLTK